MIVGIGTDIVEIHRIAAAVSRYGDRFRSRIFTPTEIHDSGAGGNEAASLAARFAAKEAFVKALGTGLASGISWTEIAVTRAETGRPTLEITGTALRIATAAGAKRWHISLSHSATTALAFIVLESE